MSVDLNSQNVDHYPALLGLLGYPLKHSFSPGYFNDKFAREGINASYILFEVEDCTGWTWAFKQTFGLVGLNVTLPHKMTVAKYLDSLSERNKQDHLDPVARLVGAVNTIVSDTSKGRFIGYNTDVYGFMESLRPLLRENTTGCRALVLGTGGAAQAVKVGLQQLGISYTVVGRKGKGDMDYAELTASVVANHPLVVQTTPVGQYPLVEEMIPFPTQHLTAGHIVFDLIYNPSETRILAEARMRGAQTLNGLAMLHLQAEKAWELFKPEVDKWNEWKPQ